MPWIIFEAIELNKNKPEKYKVGLIRKNDYDTELQVVFKGPDNTPYLGGYFEFIVTEKEGIREVCNLQDPRVVTLNKDVRGKNLRLVLELIWQRIFQDLNLEPDRIEAIKKCAKEKESSEAYDSCDARFEESLFNYYNEVAIEDLDSFLTKETLKYYRNVPILSEWSQETKCISMQPLSNVMDTH